MQIQVSARNRLNPTGLHVEAGQRLTVTAEGEWIDWFIPADADGFSRPWLKPSERFRRLPDAPWFRLCGAVGEDDSQLFALGRTAEVRAPATGPLYLFANDVRTMYWNNRGQLDVAVELHAD